MQMIIAENEKHKAHRMHELEKERLEEVEAQQRYIEVLDKQEKDRAREMKRREDLLAKHGEMNKKFTEFTGKKTMSLEDEDKFLKRQREIHEAVELRKRAKADEDKRMMQATLDQQIKEREIKKVLDHEMVEEQAEMWRQDRAKYEDIQKRKKESLAQELKNHQNFLQKQIEYTGKHNVMVGMNKQEWLMNKNILNKAHNSPTNSKKRFH